MSRTVRRIMSFILILAAMFSIAGNVALADTIVLQPPQKYRVTDIGYIHELYASNWYAQLNWDPVSFPGGADRTYLNMMFNEVEYGTGKILPDVMKVALPGGATGYELNDYTPEGIKHGTIYESYLRSYYEYSDITGTYTISSPKSTPVKFLTNLHVSLELIPGTNNIKIVWDDVWDTTGRINYRILISDTKGFSNPPPIPDIIGSEIGQSGSPVTVNVQNRKLEYIYTSALPGREYSIKVIPLPKSNVACATAEDIEPVTIKTDILLKAQRVGYTENGDVIWRLFWNPIVKGQTFTRVDYELYRYVDNELNGTLFRLIPEEDSYEFVVKKDDPHTYSFKMDAKAYVKGQPAPIEFRSNNKVVLKEQIPVQPEAPELVDHIPDAYPEPLSYDDLLTSDSATIFWKVPYTGEGVVDNDITYDIYLLEDIRYVSNPPDNYKIASSVSMTEANQIRHKLTGEVIAYRYDLKGLKSNSTYYFVIYAKKNFLVDDPDTGYMVTKPFVSKQAIKVIITDPDTGADRPIAPSAPPLRLAQDDSVTFTGATLKLDKKWHAFFDEAKKRWEYCTYQEFLENGNLGDSDPDKRISTIVNYLPGWTVIPHVVEFNSALEAINARGNRDSEYITYSDLSQPDVLAFEISQNAVRMPNIAEDADDQSFTFEIDGLEHNTTYIVWVTIENQNGLSSDPSDPLIITTPPDIPEKPIKPTVPDDLRGIAGDSFVDLFWTFTLNMDYEIKGGKEDNIQAATITAQVPYDEIRLNTYKRIEGLEPDTVYYFWIKAISRGPDGHVEESVYSNPLVIRTAAFTPPAPPTGFGIKAGADGVTETTITYVWNNLTQYKYYLEIADNADYNNARMIEVSGGEYTVTGLISNRGYYARLYAYEERTGLRSQPTRTILVFTNKSRNEYDGSFDLSEPVTGTGLVIPVTLEDGVWVITSLGDQSHLLAERIRSTNSPVVKIDLSEPPAVTTKIRLDMGSEVYDALADLKKELYVVLPWGRFTIRPGTFHTDNYFRQKGNNSNLSLSIDIICPASEYKPSEYMQIKTSVSDFKVAYSGNRLPVSGLIHPIRVELPVANIASYLQDQLKVYSYNTVSGWYALDSFIDYSNQQVVGELDNPGPVVAATYGVKPQSGVPSYIKESMDSIQKVYKLKGLEGKSFDAQKPIPKNEILKLIMDVVPTQYSANDINIKALQAGLIESLNEADGTQARRDWAVKMLMALYKFKTHERIVPTKPAVWQRYQDLSRTNAKYLDAFRFALENAIVQGDGLNNANPDKIITYGDFIVMLYRTLRLCGEI